MGSRRWQTAMLAGALMLSGCSGNNPASPGSVNPPLGSPASTPAESAAARQAAEKVTVHGSVADSRTGEGVPKATIYLQAVPEAPSAMPLEMASDSASASAPAPAPDTKTSAEPPKPIKLGVDDKGQFEVKDLSPGLYQITAFAPGYQPVTIIGVRPAQLHFELTPLTTKAGHAMTGHVKTAADKPASGARVVAGFTPGKTLGDAMTVGGDGKFDFKNLRSGKLPIAAYLAEGADITAWALQREIPVALGKEKVTPSPTLTLRAVTAPLILSGKVTSPTKELKPRQVHVLLVDGEAEIPLVTRNPDKDGFFRFSLPALEEGQSYHLIAMGLDDEGNTAYSHLHQIGDSELKLELALPDLPAKPEFQPQDLAFGAYWKGASNASVYRLRVESTGDDAQTVWEGWTSGTTLAMPEIATLPILSKGKTYRATFSAIKVAENTPYELTSVPSAPWATAASLAPFEFKAGSAVESSEAPPSMGEAPAPKTVEPKPESKPEVKPETKPAPARPKGQVI